VWKFTVLMIFSEYSLKVTLKESIALRVLVNLKLHKAGENSLLSYLYNV